MSENIRPEGEGTQTIDTIIPKESLDPAMTFALDHERDATGREIKAEASWVSLKDRGLSAEGKLFLPKNADRKKLIIFEPGMPGDSTGWMEKRYVSALTQNGYSVLVLRHLGTKLEGEKAQNYINCPERSARGAMQGKTQIGEEKTYTVEHAAHEVSVAANALGKQYEEVSIIGHSHGALNILYAFPEIDTAVQERTKRVISLSGLVGDDTFTEGFHKATGGIEGYYQYCGNLINLGTPAQNAAADKRMFAEIAKRGKHILPEHVMIQMVHSSQDEYMQYEAADELRRQMGRGLNIVDYTQTEAEFHDLKNLRLETMLRLLSMHYPKSSHKLETRSVDIKK